MARSLIKILTIKFAVISLAVLSISVVLTTEADAAHKVTTYKDDKGWKLQVDGKDFYVKGFVWGYSPRGENYNYNLWGQPDDFIRKVLDHDFGLMQKAGVNSIRAFSNIPPKWVTYIYEQYGIMTSINPLMGRYGATIDGVWVPQTDYSHARTREVLKQEVLDIVRRYKDTPGVLMYALGNESNYGLEWSADFEIENLPKGEKQKAKAKYLYTLYQEIIAAGKKIDPDRPFTIVNGDIQYIDLIKDYVPDLDLLGSNVYRGIGFTSLWKDVDEKLDLPVLFFEFGADAFNSKNFAEDQGAQASFLRGQWQEMYNKAYGNGQEGNSIGGYVFEFRDEWWKYKQTENLDIHDRTASWGNGGYTYDYVDGKNNMNEEWWGVTRLGRVNADGVYVAEPRAAYYVLSDIWAIDPYKYKTESINTSIRDIDLEHYMLLGDVVMLKSENEQRKAFTVSGGSLEVEFVGNAFSSDLSENGEEGVENTNGQMVFVDFEFNPTDDITGQFSINVLGNVADKTMEISYGRRGLPFVVQTDGLVVDGVDVSNTVIDDNERVEIYDYNGTYKGENYDLETFYHVPRFHWGYEGDFYGLLRETTDMEGQDIWNSKAPYGAEFQGKGDLDGFKFLLGPEVYWGANPKAMFKYEFDVGGSDQLAFIHSEDVARKDDSATATSATDIQTRQTTLYSMTKFGRTIFEIGGIMASTEKVGDKYTRIDNGNTIVDEIDFEDTLGVKANLSFNVGSSRAYIGANYGGLVADGGEPVTYYGVGNNGINNRTEIPYAAFGNKQEVDAGIQMNFGDYTILPRIMYRENLVDANPLSSPSTSGNTLFPGSAPRNRDDNAFAVLDNRAARSAEIFFTYDPTPATGFYEWDNDRRENAPFAFNIGANYTSYPTATDSYQFFYTPGGANASFGEGLPSEDVWKLVSRMVFNTDSNNKYIYELEGGLQQSTGTAEGPSREYYKIDTTFYLNNSHVIEGYVWKDAWGPYDFYQQFNLTYPWQFKLDYGVLMRPFDWGDARGTTSKWGVRALYRTLDDQSPNEEYLDGQNNYMLEIIAYMIFKY